MDDTHLFPVKQGSRGHPSYMYAHTHAPESSQTDPHSPFIQYGMGGRDTVHQLWSANGRCARMRSRSTGQRCMLSSGATGAVWSRKPKPTKSLYLAGDNSIVLYKFGPNAKRMRFEMDLVLLAWPRRMHQSPRSIKCIIELRHADEYEVHLKYLLEMNVLRWFAAHGQA